MKNAIKYFRSSLLLSGLGLLLGAGVGHYYTGTVSGTLSILFVVVVLCVLEISLSFDNAVVNATVLRHMTELWRRRFLTWGILIAVFGMRLVFPLLIVGVTTGLNPWDALVLAALKPDEYAEIMLAAHVSVAAFGGAFLLMVGLKYFFDVTKEVHWIQLIEAPLTRLGRLNAIEIALCLLTVYGISKFLPEADKMTFIVSGVFGLITFILTDGVAAFLEVPSGEVKDLHKASAGMFLYLEVLDASFSFDGVVGAFAITNNLFVIAIGLGIGALFVRSMTIYLVAEGTLSKYLYLEHGAFYAIGALAMIMFLNTFVHIPEVFTGLIGAAIIGVSFVSSVMYNRKHGSQSHSVEE